MPEIAIGSLKVGDVAALGTEPALFDWPSRKPVGPVVGFIGANVLKRYRIEIDDSGRMTCWEGGTHGESRDLDIVGLTVRAETGGSFTVAGATTRDGAPAVTGVEIGDVLLRVGSLDRAGATMGAVVEALRGRPDETRTLVAERRGWQVAVEARVSRLP